MILDAPMGPSELRGKMVTAEADHAFKLPNDEEAGQPASDRTVAPPSTIWAPHRLESPGKRDRTREALRVRRTAEKSFPARQ